MSLYHYYYFDTIPRSLLFHFIQCFGWRCFSHHQVHRPIWHLLICISTREEVADHASKRHFIYVICMAAKYRKLIHLRMLPNYKWFAALISVKRSLINYTYIFKFISSLDILLGLFLGCEMSIVCYRSNLLIKLYKVFHIF